MATKKLTMRYWKSLSEGSRKRALYHVFPTQPSLVEMLLDELPSKESILWNIVFSRVRIPGDSSFYKTCVNQTYIP